ncbi:MAG: amidohydrolase family protein [Rhodospirillales bacterium]|nr:amidohydrolase family protein [Rhodospirillales bacterium]
MQIDAHQHFWRLERSDYGWLTPEAGPIYRDFLPADLEPLLIRHRIDATILVQAAPSVAETEFLLALAARTPFVAGVVGWVDLAAADAPGTIGWLAADPLLVGLRPMVQDIADDEWLLRPDLAPALAAMTRHRLLFDALVLPRHLPRLLVFLDRYPELSVVLDHSAKPQILNRTLDPWRADVAAIAARPEVSCKLSGLVTEAGANWRIDDLRPYVEHLCAVFGPERLLWGSDWPVVERARGYDAWRSASLELLSPLAEGARAAVFGGNAARLYLGARGRSAIPLKPAQPPR